MLNKLKNGTIWFLKSWIWLFVLMIGLDILSKNLIVNCLKTPGTSVVLINGFLRVSYVVNTNAAFGVGIGDALANRIMYIVIASLASIILIAVFIKQYKKLTRMYKATMMLILTGAIGNLIDRIAYTPAYLNSAENGVVDWIDFYGIWKYVFNWADSCIVVGCIMLIIYLIVLEVKDNKKKKVELAKTEKKETAVVVENEVTVEENPTQVVEEKPQEDTPVVIEEIKEETSTKVTKSKASSKKASSKKNKTNKK